MPVCLVSNYPVTNAFASLAFLSHELHAAVRDDEVNCDEFDDPSRDDNDSTIQLVLIDVSGGVVGFVHYDLECFDSCLCLDQTKLQGCLGNELVPDVGCV